MTMKPTPAATRTPGAKLRAAFASILASAGLSLAKMAAGLMSGSLALVSEGAHNVLDTGASCLTYFAVREADKPADKEHPFGHAKIEAVAALAETGLLAVLAVAVAFEAIQRLGEAAQGRRQRAGVRRHRRLDRRSISFAGAA